MVFSAVYSAKGQSLEVKIEEENKILKGVDKRIEKYRKGTANLNIVWSNKTPVSGAKIKVEQTEHEFLFGANYADGMFTEILPKKLGINLNMFGVPPPILTKKQVNDYLKKFNDFANYGFFINHNWAYYESKRGEFNDKAYNKVMDWMIKNNKFKIMSGPLVWNRSGVPYWALNNNTRIKNCDDLTAVLKNYVKHFVSNFGNKFNTIEVLNELAEPFADGSNQLTPCIEQIGKIKWGKKWLDIARSEKPKAKLLVNEGNIDITKSFPKLLDGLVDIKGKYLYDIIGIQSHMHNKLWQLDQLWKGLEFYSKYKVPIHFTEVTVLSGTPIAETIPGARNWGKATTPLGEKQQAEYVVKFYALLFSHPAVESIMWFDLTDHYSWMNAPAGLLRQDMSPKPAYTALMNLIYNKWRTITQIKTNRQGKARFKGFYGDYKITVSAFSKKPQTFNIKLSKGRDNNFKFVLK